MSFPEVIHSIEAARKWVLGHQREGLRVGVVPTMGALHAGHLSLAEQARSECDQVIATIFVNPTQFAPGEDYDRYPRDLERDTDLLANVGVNAVFAPSVEAMYPTEASTRIEVGPVAEPLEGSVRPTHFGGVATIVAKLLNIVPADRAFFGRKDYQQTVVIRRMVADLNLPTEIVICPTIREADGLAMSSRNAYLSAEERAKALCLSRGLQLASNLHKAGERDASVLREKVHAEIVSVEGVEIDYVAVLREGTVEPVSCIDGPTVVAVAARVGSTRLIDNVLLS